LRTTPTVVAQGLALYGQSAVPTNRSNSPWIVFAIAAAGGYIPLLDLSIVNVAFAEIATAYPSATRADIAWVIAAYNILFGSLLVVGGRVADASGRKRVFLAGALVFGLGSLISAVSPNLPILISGRAVQGLGAAFLTPATLGLLLAAFPIERRTQIVSLWAAVGALGVASGPTLGAWLISIGGWRLAFLINIPVVLGVLFVGQAKLPESTRSPSVGRNDLLGAAMITAAMAALVLGVSRSDIWGWSDPRTVVSLAVAVALAPLFLRRQKAHPKPIVDLALFSHRSFSLANVATLLFIAGFAAMQLNNVLFLRTVWEFSVLRAGLVTVISPAAVAVVSPLAGKLAATFGFRPLLVCGPSLFGMVMLANLAMLDAKPRLFLWLCLSAVMGIAVGLTFPVLSSAAVSTLEPDRFAIGGALNATFRQVGTVIGVAVLVAVQGIPDDASEILSSFRRGWWLIVLTSAVAALAAAQLPGRSVTTRH
jgi:EmrB/QacA subfamily drug resistance transporter